MTGRGAEGTRLAGWTGGAALSLVLLLGLVARSAGHSGSGMQEAVPDDLREMHDLLNRHRESVGCPALGWHRPSARVAESHSRDMVDRDYFDHVSPDGVDPGERLLEGGVTWSGAVAENIARTPAGALSAGELWLDSAPHRANIERCEFTHHGVGGFGDRWTQVLVQDPRPAS